MVKAFTEVVSMDAIAHKLLNNPLLPLSNLLLLPLLLNNLLVPSSLSLLNPLQSFNLLAT